jgi:hypothetical protein
MTTDPDDLVNFAYTEAEVRQQVLEAMEDMITFLREHPQLPIPYGIGGACFLEENEARKGREGTHGWKKEDNGNYIHYSRTWGPNDRVSYSIYVDKSTSTTCHQVQVGVKSVDAVPAHEEPIMKWVCEPTGEKK